MKLDNDLIRTILFKLEEITDGYTGFPVEGLHGNYFLNENKKLFMYHIKYLSDANFIQYVNGYVSDITPLGHDFLNNVRDNKVWNKTKEAIKPLGTVAINVVSEIASNIIKGTFRL